MIGLSILFPCMPLQWECKGHPLFDDYLDECRREKAGKRPFDRPDAPFGGEE